MVIRPNSLGFSPRRARLLVSVLTASAGLAQGQSIFVEQFQAGAWRAIPGFGAPGGGSGGLPSGSDVTLELAGSTIVRISTDDPAQTDIGLITITAPAGSAPTVLVARNAGPSIITGQAIGLIAARSIGGLIAPATATVQLHAGSITGAGIEAGRVARVDLTGDLDAPIISWGTPGQTLPGVAAVRVGGSVTTNGSIIAVHGRIDRIDVAGDVLGDIAAQNGGIIAIDVAGSIGNAGTASTIYSWAGAESHAIRTLLVDGSVGSPDARARILAGGPVIRIEADEVHAEVDTQLNPSDPGYMGGMIVRAGDLTGSVLVEEISGFGGWSEAPCVLSVAGSVDAQIFVEHIVRNENPTGPEIDITGGLSSDSIVSVGGMFNQRTDLPGARIRVGAPGGLEGAVIVHDRELVNFDRDDAVEITGVGLLVTPETRQYLTLFSELGGGTVAIAPFNFHPFECFPQHNETIDIAPGSALVGAVVRLYGPAFGAAPAFVVEHRADQAAAWIDRSNDFVVVTPTDEIDATREVRIEAIGAAGFDPGEWRLRPVDDTIRSAFTIGLPGIRFDSEYADDTYRFTVRSDCNNTGGRTTLNDLRGQDVGDYVTPVDPGVDPCP